jgi:epoxide hydrolase
LQRYPLQREDRGSRQPIPEGDMFRPPKVWGERTYPKLFYLNEVPNGGHFVAFEQTELFIVELRKSLAQVR